MKQVTKERIIKALDNSSKYVQNKPEVHIMRTLATIGMRATIHGAFGDRRDPVTVRDRLELAYQGFTDPAKVLRRLSHWEATKEISSAEAIQEAWIESFERTIDRRIRRDERILAIQAKHDISGLVEETVQLGEVSITLHTTDEQLNLLSADLDILFQERERVAASFVEAVKKAGRKLYRRSSGVRNDDWIVSKPQLLTNLVKNCRWVRIWESKSYINRQQLMSQGYAPVHAQPQSADDELKWQFNLSTGDGEDPDTDTGSIWFCGRLGNDKPSL